MGEARASSMNDIGVGIPILMPKPIEQDLLDEVLRYAAVGRKDGLRMARREIAKDRAATLRIVLTLLKTLFIPRTEKYLASDAVRSKKIDCGAGCDHCCYQSVEVSIPEAILVALQVADPADPRYAKVLEMADATADLSPGERASYRYPCAFLVDHRCSVYENRPLLCRATMSPSAKGCRDVMEGKTKVLEIYTLPQLVALGDIDGLRGICKDLGLQYDRVDLVQTVAAILRDPTTVVRWAQGEKVFTPLKKDDTPLSPQDLAAEAPQALPAGTSSD